MGFPANPSAANLVARSLIPDDLGPLLTAALQRRTAGGHWYRPAIGSQSNVGAPVVFCSAWVVAGTLLHNFFNPKFTAAQLQQRSAGWLGPRSAIGSKNYQRSHLSSQGQRNQCISGFLPLAMAFPANLSAATLVARSLIPNGLGPHLAAALQRRTAGGHWYRPAVGSQRNVGQPGFFCSALLVAETLLRNFFDHNLTAAQLQQRSAGWLGAPPAIGSENDQRSHLSSTSDAALVEILDSMIYYAERDRNRGVIPERLPFEIQDGNGMIITLRRKYQDEKIEVIVGKPGKPDYGCDCDVACKCDYLDASRIPLTVMVKKGEESTCLEFTCTSSFDEVVIDAVSLKQQDSSKRRMLAYEGPDFNDLDERLQKSFHEYLELRGVSHVTFCFLHLDSPNEGLRSYLHWYRRVKQFVER